MNMPDEKKKAWIDRLYIWLLMFEWIVIMLAM